MDDFGIGYSSLSSLRQLRADWIKIERSFVTGLGTSDGKHGRVLAVLGLSRLRGLEFVAVVVESAEHLHILQVMGCPFLQGDHLGRQMPVHSLEPILFVTGMRVAVPRFGRYADPGMWCDHPGQRHREHEGASRPMYRMSCELALVAGRLCNSPGCAVSADP